MSFPFRFLVPVSVGILLGGCVSVKEPFNNEGDYPADWPPIAVPGTSCIEIEGSYLNQGVVVKPGEDTVQEEVLLSTLLQKTPAEDEAHIVALRLKPSALSKYNTEQSEWKDLEIVFDEDELQLQVIYNCQCMNDRLSIPTWSDVGGVSFVFFAGGEEVVWLTKAADGSLIAKAWTNWFGMVTVVPIHSKKYVWARFLPSPGDDTVSE